MPWTPIGFINGPLLTDRERDQQGTEGWCAVDSPSGPLLVADPEAGVFGSDEAAWAHVWARSQAGDRTAARSLAMLWEEHPGHFVDLLDTIGVNVETAQIAPER